MDTALLPWKKGRGGTVKISELKTQRREKWGNEKEAREERSRMLCKCMGMRGVKIFIQYD